MRCSLTPLYLFITAAINCSFRNCCQVTQELKQKADVSNCACECHSPEEYIKPTVTPNKSALSAEKLTGVDSEGDGLFGQDGAGCQVLDVAGVVIPAVFS